MKINDNERLDDHVGRMLSRWKESLMVRFQDHLHVSKQVEFLKRAEKIKHGQLLFMKILFLKDF